jgi:hypothetical protein
MPYSTMAVCPDLWKTAVSKEDGVKFSPSGACSKTLAWLGVHESSDMIHEILSSDVEFARGMIDSSHSDAEILASLTARGLEPAKAAGLLDDLRHGRKPSAQLAFVPGPVDSLTTKGPQPAGATAPWSPEPPRKRLHRRRHHRNSVPWWFILVVLIFTGALGYAFLQLHAYLLKESADKVKHELPSAPGR